MQLLPPLVVTSLCVTILPSATTRRPLLCFVLKRSQPQDPARSFKEIVEKATIASRRLLVSRPRRSRSSPELWFATAAFKPRNDS